VRARRPRSKLRHYRDAGSGDILDDTDKKDIVS
jgi:hypothetical protein